MNMLRSCTASLSSRSLARASCTRGTAVLGARQYSDATAESSTDAGKEERKSEEAVKLTPEQEKLKAKEAEVVDLTGRLRYLQADFLNLQRNAAREKEQTREYAITRFAGDLLETVDTLALALKSVPPAALSASSTPPPSESVAGTPSSPPTKTADAYLRELHTGVELTQRALMQTFFKYHIKPFDPTDDVFDPNRHEALYQAPIPGKTPGTVIECQKLGYTIKDRVLRAAQVGVVQEVPS